MLQRYIFTLIAVILATGMAVAQGATKIPIKVVEGEHGKIINQPDSAEVGAYVDFGVKPDNGYEIDNLVCYYIKTENGEEYQVIVPLKEAYGELHYYFYMPECVRIEIHVTFKPLAYAITIDDNIEHGSVVLLEPTGDIIHYRDAVRMLATPDTDYIFGSVTVTTARSGKQVECAVFDAEGKSKYIDFYMPNDTVIVKATFKPVPLYPIKVPQYDKGTMTPFPSAMAKQGETISLVVNETDRNYQVANVKVFAGYEITGGGGTVHAPGLKQNDSTAMWYVQQEIPVNKVTRTLYTFTLPEQFDNVLSPGYQDDTEFRVTFDVEYVGPQVLYCEDNTTLYFVNPGYIVNEGDTWLGYTVTKAWAEGMLDVGWNIPGWNEYKEEVTLVDFALDFAKARPKSCYAWFYQFDKAQFAYLKYLNTSEVTNMNSMFNGCNAITSLDVNTFDVSKVTNATSMFRGCSNLTTIYCDSTWEIETAPLMFLGSEKLLGAVAYNGSITDGSMANPHTGYFTGKWNISIPEVEGGSVSCNKQQAFTNDSVAFTVTALSGYTLKSVAVETVDASQSITVNAIQSRGTEVEVVEGENGQFSFKMPAAPVVVKATFVSDTPTAVSNLSTDSAPSSGTRYDIMGRKVDRNYKGIVIENGTKKIIR